jgi:hypothetical protein
LEAELMLYPAIPHMASILVTRSAAAFSHLRVVDAYPEREVSSPHPL